MGGISNATDNFSRVADAQPVNVEETKAEVAAVLDSVAQSDAPAEHVHGPDCGHDHSEEQAKEPPKGKYLTPAMIPALDLKATFDSNNTGPIWRKLPVELLTNIAFQAANVPEGGVKVCFVNNEAYKFLLAVAGFRQRFQPASAEQQKLGIVGLFDTHVVIVCDALWEQGEQLTMHKAIYFCDEVLAPVQEVVVETAEHVHTAECGHGDLKADLKELHATAIETAIENGATSEQVASAQLS